ncbi:uncharacterized protein [Miscanthus floridulus]|uniref:uncharacterized protein n=1 Tax=Miscanthus floridulus TaxID=154761 RepID=UPI003459BA31
MAQMNQGGLTELMLEQIMSSQEDIDHTERGTMQVHEATQGSLTDMLIANDMNALEETLAPQPDSSISDSRMAYQDFGGHYDEEIPNFLQDIPENENHHWQIDIFNNMHIDEELTASENGFSSINAPISRTTEAASTATEDEHNSNDNQFLTEEEIDEFIIAEQVAASEGNNGSIDSAYTPQSL